MQPHRLVVLLSGGIASGKSLVSERFASLGADVVDTDVIAREVVQPGEAGLEGIREAFGEDFLNDEGQLDRPKMRQAIFEDASLRAVLESILHPLIHEQALKQIATGSASYAILVVPLLRENGNYDWVNRILIVDCSEEEQIRRVLERDGIERNQAEAILASQISREKRLEMADDIIRNDGAVEDLDAAVDRLHELYLSLA